ncbi:thiopurine S-methyltransferase [Oceanimonas baumannii]|uniref:Thiopurine S-methyltransferase n=1 Tax=Oceanimonas baumannii TaxID=129578 RepID=A0A235CAB4_9GAMM|nr:thiopurine S-methyltransferase [Oceanimonas baumannii]OYD21339.1 thiopurine S-methyltransferase [Oceanimonas baumannii]TDW55775.1 thiopurine S-methyltransferase [Oceanimonas baumannii]
MDADFWHERWQSARIGFHQADINAHLQQYWQHTDAEAGDEVLVPLCGKSHDMRWLAQQGHAVAGFELSPVAVNDFFAEAGLTPSCKEEGPLLCWQQGPFSLYQGDFFKAGQLGLTFKLAYDRAALIALPPDMRPAYAELMAGLMAAGGRVLLVTVDHDSKQDQTPPFAVAEAEVRALFEPYFELKVLEQTHAGELHRRVASGECSYFDELCYLLTRR